MGGITIDISYYPGRGEERVKQNENGYYYESGNGTILLTDEWYPDPEGIYRKLTHTPKGGKISKINKGGASQNGFGALSSYSSVSVYYWSGDHTFNKPLLIQLGTGDKYYKHSSSLNNWIRDSEATNNLRDSLNKQNCKKNDAHIIDLKNKGTDFSSTTYQCPGCNAREINVALNTELDITYYSPYPYRSGPLSITSFKDNGTYQAGLPSLKGISEVKVIWNRSGNNPILVAQPSPGRFFRKTSGTSNTWIEVSNAGSLPNGQFPTITTLDLSSSSGTYSEIKMAVLSNHIGDGYYRYQYSLRGTLFTVGSISHSGTTLNGVSYRGTLISTSGFYYGGADPQDMSKLLLVELSIKTNNQTKYSYYQKDKDGTDWTPLSRSGETTKLVNLKQTLDEIKKIHNHPKIPESSPPPTVKPDLPTEKSKPTENKQNSESPKIHHESSKSGDLEESKPKLDDSTSGKYPSSPVGPAVGGTIGALVAVAIIAAFVKHTIKVDDATIIFEIWDTAGQERYRTLAPMYYRGSAAAIIVYDITVRDSFDQAKSWIQELKSYVEPNIVLGLAGNKVDLEDQRSVNLDIVKEFAKANDCIFMETSAKTGHNINKLFMELARKIPREKRVNDFQSGFRIDFRNTTTNLRCCTR